MRERLEADWTSQSFAWRLQIENGVFPSFVDMKRANEKKPQPNYWRGFLLAKF
jgi:hypothetical protein